MDFLIGLIPNDSFREFFVYQFRKLVKNSVQLVTDGDGLLGKVIDSAADGFPEPELNPNLYIKGVRSGEKELWLLRYKSFQDRIEFGLGENDFHG